MASHEEQDGSNDACAQSSDATDTSETVATKKENHAGEIDGDQHYLEKEEINNIAPDNITKSVEADMVLGGIEEVCNEFSTKTWKEDLTVIVAGKHLYVNSGVLALISPVFSSLLEAVFKEEGPRTLELSDNYGDFVEFLRCIYPGIMKLVTKENALTIVYLAHKYQIENIAGICKSILLDMVCGQSTLESLTSIFNIASSCELTSLGDKCMLEITRRSVPESELNQLELSPDIRLEMKTAKVRYLEDEVKTLQQRLQQKTDRCDEFEYLVRNTWVEDLKITHSARLELHMISVNVIDNRGDNVDPVCFKNMTWTLDAEVSDKPLSSYSSYSKQTRKVLSVVLSAQGDRSWRQWTCKVKASCNVFDGDQRQWKQTSAEIGSSTNQLIFDPYLYLKWTNPLKVSVIFAVGDVIV